MLVTKLFTDSALLISILVIYNFFFHLDLKASTGELAKMVLLS